MMPHLGDLDHVEEELNLGVEVAKGHIVKSTTCGVVINNMVNDEGLPLKATLHDVIYVPGLKWQLFSITAFANQVHLAVLHHNEIHMMFGMQEPLLTIPLANGISLASNTAVRTPSDIPTPMA